MIIAKHNKFIIILVSVLIIILSTIIIFSEPKDVATVENSCIVGGCSGQLCVESGTESGMSTCEWKEVYGCYKKAVCERQATGKCGFTANPEFSKCLSNNR